MSISLAHCDASPCLTNSRGEQFERTTENIKGEVRPKPELIEKLGASLFEFVKV
jgi:hypothetical protein